MKNVIDLASRSQFRVDQHNDEREQKALKFVEACADSIFVSALKINAVAGPQAAVEVLTAVLADMEKRK